MVFDWTKTKSCNEQQMIRVHSGYLCVFVCVCVCVCLPPSHFGKRPHGRGLLAFTYFSENYYTHYTGFIANCRRSSADLTYWSKAHKNSNCISRPSDVLVDGPETSFFKYAICWRMKPCTFCILSYRPLGNNNATPGTWRIFFLVILVMYPGYITPRLHRTIHMSGSRRPFKKASHTRKGKFNLLLRVWITFSNGRLDPDI